jgi:hypothetical protein
MPPLDVQPDRAVRVLAGPPPVPAFAPASGGRDTSRAHARADPVLDFAPELSFTGTEAWPIRYAVTAQHTLERSDPEGCAAPRTLASSVAAARVDHGGVELELVRTLRPGDERRQKIFLVPGGSP